MIGLPQSCRSRQSLSGHEATVGGLVAIDGRRSARTGRSRCRTARSKPVIRGKECASGICCSLWHANLSDSVLTLQFNHSIAHPVHHCPSRSARRMARSREIHSSFCKLEGSERCANLQGLNRLRSRTRSQRTLSNALWSRGNHGAQLERLDIRQSWNR